MNEWIKKNCNFEGTKKKKIENPKTASSLQGNITRCQWSITNPFYAINKQLFSLTISHITFYTIPIIVYCALVFFNFHLLRTFLFPCIAACDNDKHMSKLNSNKYFHFIIIFIFNLFNGIFQAQVRNCFEEFYLQI